MIIRSSINIGGFMIHIRPRVRERGQGLVEYALALVLVAVVVIVVLALTGTKVRTVFCDIVYQLRTNNGNTNGISACPDPHISFTGIGNSSASAMTVEAIILDDEGSTTANIDVTITLTGPSYPTGHVQNETTYHFCMMGGDTSCSSTTLSAGTYSLVAVARDADGNSNTYGITFVVK
jgi:pilus assembly protein Flp/PilA